MVPTTILTVTARTNWRNMNWSILTDSCVSLVAARSSPTTMSSPCMWNTQNRTQYRCDKDESGQIFVPDYIGTSPIEKREHAVSQGLQIQYDNLYIARMNNEIKNRNWV